MNEQYDTLQVGDSVRVRTGVRDEDNPDWSIEGWEGRIVEISTETPRPLYLVAWDSVTLKQMPSEMIDACEREGLDWTQYNLHRDDVEPVPTRDHEQDVRREITRLYSEHQWSHLGEQGGRIRQVLQRAASSDPLDRLDAWEDYLTDRLTFPFEAVVHAGAETRLLARGDRVRVQGISNSDEYDGLIVRVVHRGDRFQIPLADLEPCSSPSENTEPIMDYCSWFAHQ